MRENQIFCTRCVLFTQCLCVSLFLSFTIYYFISCQWPAAGLLWLSSLVAFGQVALDSLDL